MLHEHIEIMNINHKKHGGIEKEMKKHIHIIAMIDYNLFLLSEMTNSEMSADDIKKFAISRFRSIIRYKKQLGFCYKAELQSIKDIKCIKIK